MLETIHVEANPRDLKSWSGLVQTMNSGRFNDCNKRPQTRDKIVTINAWVTF